MPADAGSGADKARSQGRLSLGGLIRRSFGRHERALAEWYRGCFVDLDAVANAIRSVAAPGRIIEVGCGEGAMTERLASAFPSATILGIDPLPTVGRLFAGDAARVSFRQETLVDTLGQHAGTFDLAVLVDVIHHVPVGERRTFLEQVRALLSPTGHLVVKEWLRSADPVHLAVWASDRFLTGDRVSFLAHPELLQLVTQVFDPGSVALDRRVGPWHNNVVLALRNAPAPAARF